MPPDPTRLLRVRYRDGSDFLKHYQTTFAGGGIFYPTRQALDMGTPVVMEIRFPGLPNRVHLRGTVAWRRAGRHSLGLRAGLGIAFNADESLRGEFLLRVARGDARNLVARRFPRVPVEAPVQWRVASATGFSEGVLTDISAGGAFVRSAAALPAREDEVVLSVRVPRGLTPLDVAARVAWVRTEPPPTGFGVEFRVRDVGGLRRIKEVVRRLERATLAA